MLELYKNIKRIREEKGMSQEELAKLVGFKSRSSINKIEMGVNDITQSKLVAIANALGVSPGELMGSDGPAPPRPRRRKATGCRSSTRETSGTSRSASRACSTTSTRTRASPTTTAKSQWTTRRATSSAPPWKTPSASPSRLPRRNIRRRNTENSSHFLTLYM